MGWLNIHYSAARALLRGLIRAYIREYIRKDKKR
jgi:hypothetical protein